MIYDNLVQFLHPQIVELDFLIKIMMSIVIGAILGLERQYKGKDAGIRTYMYVILGSMIFTFLSEHVDADSTSRIAAQIVTGIGFLGAGLIIKDSANAQVRNLTTAASIWFAGGVGMIIGFGYYGIAGISAFTAIIIPLISRMISKVTSDRHKENS